MIVISLAGWAGNDLNNTNNFKDAQSFQSTANSASEVALQYVRYNFMTPTLNASPPQPCWTTGSPSSINLNNQTVSAWCTTRWNFGSSATRVVTVSVCLSTVDQATCAASPLLQVIATVGDFKTGTGDSSCSPVTQAIDVSLTTCGTTMTVNNWVFNPQPPVMSSVASYTGSCPVGSKSILVTGSNLGGVIEVYFVMSGSVRTIDNKVFKATSLTTIASGVTACTPTVNGAAVTGAAYAVVTTASGPSNFYSYTL